MTSTPASAARCPWCGQELGGDWDFCPRCAAPLKTGARPTAEARAAGPVEEARKDTGRTRKTAIPLLGMVFVGVFLLGMMSDPGPGLWVGTLVVTAVLFLVSFLVYVSRPGRGGLGDMIFTFFSITGWAVYVLILAVAAFLGFQFLVCAAGGGLG